jgi:transcriptional regulator with GAF, ATPase, and Fis domain
MAKTIVYIVGDETDVVEQAKSHFGPQGVTVQSYSSSQWCEGLENPVFRSQMMTGIPSLVGGQGTPERSNVLPFPGPASSRDESKVSTMEDLESKAIENAILQFRGNLTEAAKALGIGRATLYRKVKQYKINPSMARRKRVA